MFTLVLVAALSFLLGAALKRPVRRALGQDSTYMVRIEADTTNAVAKIQELAEATKELAAAQERLSN